MQRQDFATHDEAVDFVKDVFKSMGGVVVPPRRPRSHDENAGLTVERNNFMLDFENALLGTNWAGLPPTGAKRYEHEEWAAMVQKQVFPYHSDVDWEEYKQWVAQGGGDEWFQPGGLINDGGLRGTTSGDL